MQLIPGMQIERDGQWYELLHVVVTKETDDSLSFSLEWRTCCRDCGLPFDFETQTTIGSGDWRRTCDAHQRG